MEKLLHKKSELEKRIQQLDSKAEQVKAKRAATAATLKEVEAKITNGKNHL